MKIRQALIVVISAVCAMAQVLSAECVMRLSGIEVAPLSADTVVSGMLWDFSGSKVMGSGVLQYISRGDTAVMELLPDLRSDYAISGDFVRLTAVEGRTWLCRADSLTVLPLHDGSLSASLSMHLSRRMSFSGICMQSVSRGHTVILAPGDTISGVSLLTLSASGMLADVAADSLPQSGAGLRVEASRRYWFAAGGAYPLATDWHLLVPDGLDCGKAYVFPPHEQPHDAAVARAAMSPLSRTVAGQYSAAPRVYGADTGGPRHEATLPVVSVDGRNISVMLAAASGAAGVTVYDILGRLVAGRSVVSRHIAFTHLLPGEYLVCIESESIRYSEKILIR